MIDFFLNNYMQVNIVIKSYVLLAAITFVDYFVGPEISTAVFYLLPITLIAQQKNAFKVYTLCGIATLAWVWSDILSGQAYSSDWVYIWNSIVRFGIFIVVARLVLATLDKSRYYQHLASYDDLTGIFNRRGFIQRADEEIVRAKRFKRSFSLAFLDLDNFKAVNDQFGHQVGDKILKEFAETAQSNIRQTDHIGRLGGDEFAILFVETNQRETKKAFDKCYARLNELIKLNEWPISISVGVVTYTGAEILLSELLEKADSWMYKVKKAGKNNVIYKFDTELFE